MTNAASLDALGGTNAVCVETADVFWVIWQSKAQPVGVTFYKINQFTKVITLKKMIMYLLPALFFDKSFLLGTVGFVPAEAFLATDLE